MTLALRQEHPRLFSQGSCGGRRGARNPGSASSELVFSFQKQSGSKMPCGSGSAWENSTPTPSGDCPACLNLCERRHCVIFAFPRSSGKGLQGDCPVLVTPCGIVRGFYGELVGCSRGSVCLFFAKLSKAFTHTHCSLGRREQPRLTVRG